MTHPTEHSNVAQRNLRVTLIQPTLAKYRLPVFQQLSRRPGIALRVVYGNAPGIRNVAPEGLDAAFEPMAVRRILNHPFYWQSAQLRYASKSRTDVLILTWDVHYLSLVPALLRARAAGIPTLLWGHGYSKNENAFRFKLRQLVGSLGTGLIFYNESGARPFRAADHQHVFVAPNTLDTSPVQEAKRHWLSRPEELALFRRSHGLEPGPVLLFVARLTEGRRIDLLLKAAGMLIKQHPALKVVIIGTGPQLPLLRAMSEDLGLQQHVRFVGELYDERDLAPWFLSSRCFCFPRDMGLSLLHAFAYGLPVITSDNPYGHGPEFEALRDGENGLLFRDGDPESLAATLARLVGDPDLASRLSAGAISTVQEDYSLGNMVDRLELAVRTVAARAGAGGAQQP